MSTRVSDAGLIHLKGLKRLRELDLAFTDITDAGLKHLEGFQSLGSLDLKYTKVSETAVQALRRRTAQPDDRVRARPGILYRPSRRRPCRESAPIPGGLPGITDRQIRRSGPHRDRSRHHPGQRESPERASKHLAGVNVPWSEAIGGRDRVAGVQPAGRPAPPPGGVRPGRRAAPWGLRRLKPPPTPATRARPPFEGDVPENPGQVLRSFTPAVFHGA